MGGRHQPRRRRLADRPAAQPRPADGPSHRPRRSPGISRLPGPGEDRRQGRLRHRRPGPHVQGPRCTPAGRQDSRRPKDPGQASHRPRQRPHPPDQPASGTTPGNLSAAGARAEPDQQGADPAADRLSNSSRHPPQRCQAHQDLAEESQGQRRFVDRAGRRRSSSSSAHRAARREVGRLDGGPPRWWPASRRG